MTVADDIWVTGLRGITPTGTHHVTLGKDSGGPDGTFRCGFATIGAAMTALDQIGDATGRTVLVQQGTYNEDVAIRTSGVHIRACPGTVTLVGQEGNRGLTAPCYLLPAPPARSAALCVSLGVSGVVIDGLRISGPGLGVHVFGAEATLRNTEVFDTSSFGILISESKSLDGTSILASSVLLDHVAVLRAAAAGVLVVGSSLDMNFSAVQDSQMLNAAPEGLAVSDEERLGWERGISIHPSMWTQRADGRTEPEDFAQSTVTISRSAVTGNDEIGIYATGATISVDGTYVGALAGGASSGRGLVIERSFAVSTSVNATVEASVIERTRDAAIDVRDGTLTLRDATIRNTGGRRGDGCSGQGLRVRSMPPGDEQAVVDVETSAILESRQSAIYSAASSLHVTSSLLRDVEPEGTEAPCSASMGDGVVIETYPNTSAPITQLDRVRIEGARRAALSSVAPVAVASSTLACNVLGPIDASGQGAARLDGRAVCGCENGWQSCSMASRSIVPWACAGSSPAWPEALSSHWFCTRAWNAGDGPIPGAALWAPTRPEVVPAVTGSDGCAVLSGLLPGPLSYAIFKRGYAGVADLLPASSSSRRIFVGSALGPPPQFFGSLGYPNGTPISVLPGVRVGSIIQVEPQTVVFGPNGLPLAAGEPYPGEVGAGVPVYMTAFEPGWHRISVVPPAGWSCAAGDRLVIPGDDPTAQYLRVDMGTVTWSGMSCTETSP